ncbi:bis(5'-nucleosyl)-tetraphosphatase (symmetrical) YqeK [Virgibacillus sp. YIM 98842]|jgi:predicted HD superfamily hydrolase involved in NAD metabolism|uniref:bis(5'-nucleosyl)-tetraphosphatase (symmetrical) YqeK n=1 Tax=Virgibacillus sp. YIM 98842 TaxID=2663533 RepID=UPI0013DAADC2|nr:bis(5'-nucleosyl)-tetraphosphatase (symmetrical) YqeK [Virgibacillus sp. YIM 98842]
MKKDKAIEVVRQQLTQERFDHTLRVAETGIYLAKIYGISEKKTELAAIFHDYAKYRSTEEMARWIKSTKTLSKDLLNYHHEIWHGPVGAVLVERECGITDKDILSAIHYHTTGKAMMSKLDMIIFLADYIEPNRSFPGVEEVREMADADLMRACWMALRNTCIFLLEKKVTVYPDTFYAYNDLTNRIDGGNL